MSESILNKNGIELVTMGIQWFIAPYNCNCVSCLGTSPHFPSSNLTNSFETVPPS